MSEVSIAQCADRTFALWKLVTQLTIDDFEYTQFIVYDNETETAYPMTEENCKTEAWEADKKFDRPETQKQTLFAFVFALLNWLVEFFHFVFNR